MCLDRLVDFEVPDPGVGWKVFYFDGFKAHIESVTNLCLYPIFYEWLNAKDVFETFESGIWREELTSFHQIPYSNGFHIFLEKKDAYKWRGNLTFEIVLPVCYQNIVTTGYQDGKKVVVAKEMMIIVEEP